MIPILLLLCLIAVPATAGGTFAFRDVTPASLELSENGKPVFVYNHGMILKEGVKEQYRRSSYVHPLYAPDGTVLTDDFPKDHPHHRGLCWSWPVVRFEGQTYDVWAIQGMHQRFVRWISKKTFENKAVLAVENGWFVGDRKAVKETVELTVRAVAGDRRQFDVKLTFEAVDAPVEIAGREVKGYGGLGVRFAPRSETILRTDTGIEAKDSDMARHPWAELEGVFEGRRAGLRIQSLGVAPGWCLRHYGYIAPNVPGPETLTLLPGKPFELNYRITVFSAT